MRIYRMVNPPGVPRAAASTLDRVAGFVTVAGVVGASLMSSSAMGQQAPASSTDASPELQEIVVTGSMIKRVNAETAEAITILKSDDLKAQGIENVEQALGTLTAANPVDQRRLIHRDVFRRRYLRQPTRPGRHPHPGAPRWPAAGSQCLQRLWGRPEWYPVRGHRHGRSASGRRLGAVRLGRDRGRDQLQNQEELPGAGNPGQLRPPPEIRRQLG